MDDTGPPDAPYPFALLEDPDRLAAFREWSAPVYRDLLACQRGRMSEAAFRDKHVERLAILVLDATGFTQAAMYVGELHALLRILDVQKVCGPVLLEHGATLVRAFADDMTVIFTDPGAALDAALEIQRRIALWNAGPNAVENPPLCCIGLGYGDVFAIGPNRAMGDEMNRASKLGEDIADGGEILLTEGFYAQVLRRPDMVFQQRRRDRTQFEYYEVRRADAPLTGEGP